MTALKPQWPASAMAFSGSDAGSKTIRGWQAVRCVAIDQIKNIKLTDL
jgi:hypothetical protein